MRNHNAPGKLCHPVIAQTGKVFRQALSLKRIKTHVLAQIEAGNWKEGDAIPSEQALANEFGVARMTANRALRELSDERILVRVQGSGTYVAQQKFQSTLVEIHSIAEEIHARGHVHHSELHRLERIKAGEIAAADAGVRYRIEARLPPPEIAAMLQIDESQPCLVLHRKTLSRGQVATLWHPASRYQFTGGF